MRIFGWEISRQKRSFENPSVPLTDAIRGVVSDGAKGIVVNERTALTLSVVYSAIRLIAEDLASLPLGVYEKNKGYYKDIDHDLNYLVQVKPNSWQNAFEWKETSTASVCARGNTYSRIVFNSRGRVVGIEYLPDEEWEVVWLEDTMRRGYRPLSSPGKNKPLSQEDVIHIPFTSMSGEVKSVSPIEWLKSTIGVSLNSKAHTLQTYASGAFASGFLESDKEMSTQAARMIEDSIIRNHGGKGMRLIALEDGLKYKPGQLSPHDLDTIATEKFQIEELLRPWRVPAHMVGSLDRSTNNNIEQQSLEYVMYCLRPWAKRWEHELNCKLLSEREYRQGLRFKYNLKALLRGDVKTQTYHIQSMVQSGVMTQNEARDFLGMPSVDGGDELLVPVNLLQKNEEDGVRGENSQADA